MNILSHAPCPWGCPTNTIGGGGSVVSQLRFVLPPVVRRRTRRRRAGKKQRHSADSVCRRVSLLALPAPSHPLLFGAIVALATLQPFGRCVGRSCRERPRRPRARERGGRGGLRVWKLEMVDEAEIGLDRGEDRAAPLEQRPPAQTRAIKRSAFRETFALQRLALAWAAHTVAEPDFPVPR